MFGVGVADDVVNALGGEDTGAEAVEVALLAYNGDGEALRHIVGGGCAGAVGHIQEGDVRTDHILFALEGRDAEDFLCGEAGVDFLELADLGAERPLAWAVGNDEHDGLAAKTLEWLGRAGGVCPSEGRSLAHDFGLKCG